MTIAERLANAKEIAEKCSGPLAYAVMLIADACADAARTAKEEDKLQERRRLGVTCVVVSAFTGRTLEVQCPKE